MWSTLEIGKHAGQVTASNPIFGSRLFFLGGRKEGFPGSVSNRGRGASVEGTSYQNPQTRPRKLVC